jgi:hypothetical protein
VYAQCVFVVYKHVNIHMRTCNVYFVCVSALQARLRDCQSNYWDEFFGVRMPQFESAIKWFMDMKGVDNMHVLPGPNGTAFLTRLVRSVVCSVCSVQCVVCSVWRVYLYMSYVLLCA